METAFPGNLEEPCFSPLEARVSRQEKKVQQVEAIRFVCNDQDQMEQAVGKLFSLQQNCKKLTLPELWFLDDKGLDGEDQGDSVRNSGLIWLEA